MWIPILSCKTKNNQTRRWEAYKNALLLKDMQHHIQNWCKCLNSFVSFSCDDDWESFHRHGVHTHVYMYTWRCSKNVVFFPAFLRLQKIGSYNGTGHLISSKWSRTKTFSCRRLRHFFGTTCPYIIKIRTLWLQELSKVLFYQFMIWINFSIYRKVKCKENTGCSGKVMFFFIFHRNPSLA